MQNILSYFHHYVKEQAVRRRLVVQPRMGFSNHAMMRQGLQEVMQLNVPSIGTITLDSFTRSGDFESAARAIKDGTVLNGYPLVGYSSSETRALIAGLRAPDFPVQVRHGSPLPMEIFKATIDAGIDAIEGGPVSYCLPYGRIPLKDSIDAWRVCCRMFAQSGDGKGHIESFGGCMMGQLCPRSMLIAITIVEAMFMRENYVQSYSVSLAQGTNSLQDIAGLNTLRQLAHKYLGPESEWHIVFYTFMGKFPESLHGARALMEESVRVAVRGRAERLIVKTVKEAHEIPSIQDNINALMWADEVAACEFDNSHFNADPSGLACQIYEEADFLIKLVLNLEDSIEKSLITAFRKGYWDIPFCLHPDNKGLTSARLDQTGLIRWSETGNIPFTADIRKHAVRRKGRQSSGQLLQMLSFNQQKYDGLKQSSPVGLNQDV